MGGGNGGSFGGGGTANGLLRLTPAAITMSGALKGIFPSAPL